MQNKIHDPKYVDSCQNKFDEIVGVAYVNIFSISKNSDTINIAPFDRNNKEHLFVLNVAKGVGGIVQKKIAVDLSKFELWKLNRNIKEKECRYIQIQEGREGVVDPNELVNFMRAWATQVMDEGIDFDFGRIYDAFYKTTTKKGNK